jgi:acyl carrier protein
MGSPVHDEEITRAISQSLGVAPDQITATTLLRELVVDSFDLVQLAMDIQDDFDVIFYAEDLSDVRDVADLITLVRSRA